MVQGGILSLNQLDASESSSNDGLRIGCLSVVVSVDF